MGNRIQPTFALECKHCQHRWPRDSVVEAMLLHFQVEHDTDKVDLDLATVCTCGASMTYEGQRDVTGGKLLSFTCPACGNTARVKQGADG